MGTISHYDLYRPGGIGDTVSRAITQKMERYHLATSDLARLIHEDMGVSVVSAVRFISRAVNADTEHMLPEDQRNGKHRLAYLSHILHALRTDPSEEIVGYLKGLFPSFSYPPEIKEKPDPKGLDEKVSQLSPSSRRWLSIVIDKLIEDDKRYSHLSR